MQQMATRVSVCLSGCVAVLAVLCCAVWCGVLMADRVLAGQTSGAVARPSSCDEWSKRATVAPLADVALVLLSAAVKTAAEGNNRAAMPG